MCTTLAENPDWSREAWKQLNHSVNQLASGGEYRCYGYELPDDHPARAARSSIGYWAATTCAAAP